MNVASVLLFLFASAASAATPMQLREDGPQGRIFVPCRFDAGSTQCLLDTGSTNADLPEKSYWDSYPSKPARFKSGSGHVQDCRAIVIEDAALDGLAGVKKLEVLRCPPESLADPRAGYDLLKGKIVNLDFTEKMIYEASDFPAGATTYPLLDNKKVLSVKVSLGGAEAWAMFDTGAALDVVDKEFVKAHQELFKAEGEEVSGKDSASKEMKVQLYRVKELALGSRTFANVYAIAMDFAPFRDVVPPGSVFVVGYNTIRAQNWYLDIDHGLWATDPPPPAPVQVP